MARHVIVDGSNIATEGRTMPSLRQLNEAVTAFMQEFPHDVITVVVDATFGHRIDPSEVAEFDEAIAHNELVAPPAGAIGRGDSFILSIANKTKGSILTNDSYQEFHGEYPWVFDEGRLIGGKPVPNVGWVFVLRTSVRGPVSRKSVRAGRSVDKNTGRVPRVSKEASQPMPVPKAPPPGATIGKGGRGAEVAVADGQAVLAATGEAGRDGGGRRRPRGGRAAEATPVKTPAPAAPVATRPAPAREEPVNDLMSFINFVEHHPVGSSVNAVVESYSSHGAYVAVGDVRGYVPLRLMSDPPARSARELGKVGDAITLVVHSFTPARRSIDMAVPAAASKDGVAPTSVPVEPHEVETAAIAEAAVIASTVDTVPSAPTKPGRRPRKSAAPKTPDGGPPTSAVGDEPALAAVAPASDAAAPAKPATRAAKRGGARRTSAPVAEQPAPVKPAKATKPAKASKASKASAEAPPQAVQPTSQVEPAPAQASRPAKRGSRTTERIAANLAANLPAVAPTAAPPAKKASRKAAAKPAAPEPPVATTADPVGGASVTTPAKPARPKKSSAKSAAPKAPATSPTAKKATDGSAPAKRSAAKRAPAASGQGAAKKAPAKKAVAKRPAGS